MTFTARTLLISLWAIGALGVVLFGAALFSPRAAWAADPVEVFVDARDPAFVVVQGVAADASDLARREMAGYATLENVSLVPWDRFRQNAQDVLGPYIVRDDYPGASLVLSVVALVQTYPGRPFAVTWNGGLAVSFMDYQHAVSRYQIYSQSAEAYEQTRPVDPRQDPLNPANHMAELLQR